ncbi:MAG: LysM peptidoglycan-binding domain-containing protein, partial [Muribaculaceae bacterium]|nr:LysM peptidoglycan-binding domain-containing protein [Muribaculaceae bacterium]
KTTKSKSSKKDKYRQHKIKKGENLSKIADKYPGVSVDDIKKANGITGTKIKAGDKIKIPNK